MYGVGSLDIMRYLVEEKQLDPHAVDKVIIIHLDSHLDHFLDLGECSSPSGCCGERED